MPSARLTDKSVRSLTPGEWFDDLVAGFGLRVLPTGGRSFFIRYRRGGRQLRATLGRFPDLGLAAARAKARRILADPESGSGLTVGELVAQYLDWLPVARYRREREYRRLLTREILPALGAARIADLRRRDLIALLEAKAKTAPVVANHVHVRLSALFAWARLRDLIQANPMAEIPKPTPYRARDRVLTDDEIRTLWGSGLSLVVGACLRMILLTGQRPSEVRLMRWSEVSGSWWTIPRERSKSDRAHTGSTCPPRLGKPSRARGASPTVTTRSPTREPGSPCSSQRSP